MKRKWKNHNLAEKGQLKPPLSLEGDSQKKWAVHTTEPGPALELEAPGTMEGEVMCVTEPGRLVNVYMRHN